MCELGREETVIEKETKERSDKHHEIDIQNKAQLGGERERERDHEEELEEDGALLAVAKLACERKPLLDRRDQHRLKIDGHVCDDDIREEGPLMRHTRKRIRHMTRREREDETHDSGKTKKRKRKKKVMNAFIVNN